MNPIAVLVRIVIIVVILFLLILLGTGFVPSVASDTLTEITSLMPRVTLKEDPCSFHCYSVQEASELELITGRLPGQVADYSKALLLPTYFSCNYENLDIATHVLEMGRWVQGKVAKYYSGVACIDDLYVQQPPLYVPVNICQIPLNDDLVGRNIECKLRTVGNTPILFCPQDYCVAKRINWYWHSDTGEIKTSTGWRWEQQPDPMLESYLDKFGICGTEHTGSPCRSTGQWFNDYAMVYYGGEQVDCDISCTITADVVSCSYDDDCGDYIYNDYISCGSGYDSCVVDIPQECGDITGQCVDTCTVSGSGSNTKVNCRGQDCLVLYNAGTCDLVCGETGMTQANVGIGVYKLCTPYLNQDTLRIECLKNSDGEVVGGNFTISAYSNDLFKEIDGYNVLRLYVPTDADTFGNPYYKLADGAYSALDTNYGDRFGVLVKPTEEILAPRNRVIKTQEGLRKHHISFILFQPIADTVRPYEKKFRGAVTNPKFFENATKILYECLSGYYCDDRSLHNFKNFCKVDSFLNKYGYINCLDGSSLKDKINPEEFIYEYRTGKDIENGFYCSGNVFDACNYETYDYQDCRPSWGTLLWGKGRCEDFAIMDYTLFKTLGLPEEDGTNQELSVGLEMSQCTIPCPCKKLASECNAVTFEQESCAAPQYVTVKIDDFIGTFNACPETMNSYPNGWSGTPLNGSSYFLNIGSEEFTIIQDFNEYLITCGAEYCTYDGTRVKCQANTFNTCTLDSNTITCTNPAMTCTRSNNPYYYPVNLKKRFNEVPDSYTGVEDVSCGAYDKQDCDFCSSYVGTEFVNECADYLLAPDDFEGDYENYFKEEVSYVCDL